MRWMLQSERCAQIRLRRVISRRRTRWLLAGLTLASVISATQAGTPDESWFRPFLGGVLSLADQPSDLVLGHLDGDGDIDAAVSFLGTPASRVYLNDGAGGITPGSTLPTSAMTEAIHLVDVSGDTVLDLVEANQGSAPDRVWINSGSGTFSDALIAFPLSDSTTVGSLDLENDGDADLAFGKGDGRVEIWVNQGGVQLGTEGDFLAGQVIPSQVAGSVVLDLATPDLNADLLDDLAFLIDGQVITYVNGAGILGSVNSTPVALSTSFEFGLINNDSFPDFFAAPAMSTSDFVWHLSDGNGQFNPVFMSLPRAASHDIAVEDLNGNGAADVIVAGEVPGFGGFQGDDSNIQVWRDAQFGADFRFTGQCLAGEPGRVSEIEFADMDGDLDPDLVALFSGDSDEIRVYRNGPQGLVEVCCAAEVTYYITRSTGGRNSVDVQQGGTDTFSLATLRQLRDQVMLSRAHGMRLADDYQTLTPDLLAVLGQDALLVQSINVLLTNWQGNFEALLAGNGSTAIITSNQILAIDFILDDFAMQGSSALAQVIASERARLGALSQYVGMDMDSLADILFGPTSLIFSDGLEALP